MISANMPSVARMERVITMARPRVCSAGVGESDIGAVCVVWVAWWVWEVWWTDRRGMR